MQEETLNLNALYRRIAEKGERAVLNGGMADDFLLHPERDKRMSVALLFRIPAAVADAIFRAVQTLRFRAPELYYYPVSDYHVTVLDLLRGRENLVCSPELAASYAQVIEKVVSSSSFQVAFRGMIAAENAVLAKGYYDRTLERIRERIRSALRAEGLPLEERYETRSCHVTVARFPSRIQSPKNVLRVLSSQEETVFGSFTVESLELVYHNWYDSKKEIFSEIPLR